MCSRRARPTLLWEREMTGKNKGPDPENIEKDLDTRDRRLYDEHGAQGPFAHVMKPTPWLQPTKVDDSDLYRLADDGGKVLD